MESGIQISSLKPFLKTKEQVQAAFHQINQLGCDVVQLQWIDPSVPAHRIAQTLKTAALTPFPFRIFMIPFSATLNIIPN